MEEGVPAALTCEVPHSVKPVRKGVRRGKGGPELCGVDSKSVVDMKI